MPSDYPDYTDLMQIIGSDIMIPIDVQAAYIMMPVDIQAQYLTLDIDIVAQTVGNIAIDLAAQSVGNILVDIKAQTIGNLTIDLEAQSIGIYLIADWSALQSTDKNFIASGTDIATGDNAYGSYTVPSAKTLYITGFSFRISANAAASRDLNQMGWGYLYNQTDGISLAVLGGNGGNGLVLSKPAVIVGDKVFRYYVYNMANHNCDIDITAWGFEI